MRLSELKGLPEQLARDFVRQHRLMSVDTNKLAQEYLAKHPKSDMLPPMAIKQTGQIDFVGNREVSVSLLCEKNELLYFALRTLCSEECYARSYIPGVGWTLHCASMSGGFPVRSGTKFDELMAALVPLNPEAEKAVATVIEEVQADVRREVLDPLFSNEALNAYADSKFMEFDAGGGLEVMT